MTNPVFADAITQLKAVLAGVEAEMERQSNIHAQQEAIRQTLRALEKTEADARLRLAKAEGDVALAQQKYREATVQAQQILADARAQAMAIRDKAISEGEEAAERLATAALDEARQSVRRKRGAAGA